VLASASPRRRELLSGLGLPFDVLPADVDESLPPGADANSAVVLLAERKALGVFGRRPDALVLAADTLVVADGRLLGKPAGPAEARTFLGLLRGRTHHVLTGVSVSCGDSHESCVVSTRVRMRSYTGLEVETWIAGGSAFDKAGAYGIQDGEFRPVASYGGCYCSVLGLPLWDAWTMLRHAGAGAALLAPDQNSPVCRDCSRRPGGR
jgi:septum formation protein